RMPCRLWFWGLVACWTSWICCAAFLCECDLGTCPPTYVAMAMVPRAHGGRVIPGVSRAGVFVTVGTETMKALAERWKPIAILLCLILLALALTTFKTRVAPQTSLLESAALSVMMPLQQVITSLVQRCSGLWQGYINLVQVRQENLRL